MLAEGQRVLTKSCRECRVSFSCINFFLILNVCVVFQSDNEKLVYFFRLPSCRCDICGLEKVNLKSVKATNTKPRQECDLCRIGKKMGKMTWRAVLSFIS